MKPPPANALIYVALLFLCPLAAAQTSSSPRDAERRVFNEIVSGLEAKNISFTERSLMADYGAFGVSVEVNIPARPGSDGIDGIFALAVPILDVPAEELLNGVENRQAGAGPAWQVELAFGLIDKLLSEPQPFDSVVYFAADNWPAAGSGDYPYAGFQALLDDTEAREEAVIVYCDSPPSGAAAPQALTVLRGRGAASSPLGLVEPFIRLCAESGIPCFFDSDDDGGGGAAADSLEGADGRHIIHVTGAAPSRFTTPPAGEKIAVDDAVALFCRYAEEIFRGGLNAEEADRNYAYISFKNGGIFIPELTLVLLTLFGLVFVAALCFCLYYAAKSRYKHILIPVFAVFIVLTASFLFVLSASGGKNLPEPPPAPRTRVVAGRLESQLYFTVDTESRRFLDHRIVRISMEARFTPLRYSLFFTDQAVDNPDESPAYFIYDAPMPYTSDGKRIKFILGPYPPNPLDIELTLPLNLNGEFRIEGLFPGNVTAVKTFTVPRHD